ncbi:MAG TPA: PKD domain-containing protein, partial [Bacteroidales bacterium]|nr:PKD domain-containing protein [Bacteroidales bacterium]
MTGLSKFWWDFGDGSPVDSTNANPVHTFTNNNPASIEYRSIKLKVRSPGGCYDEFTSTVTVYPAVNATFTVSDTIICSGGTISLATSPGASKYFWDFGDGQSGYSPGESTTHLYTNFDKDPLILTVKLTTTSFYSCSDDYSMTIKVMPMPQPQFNAVPPTQIYSPSGNPVTFTNQTNDGTWSYLWRFGDGTTSTEKDPSYIYTALGTYDVVLIVNNANCSDSISHEVRVLPPPPVANFDSIPSGCEPLTITINNTSLNTDVPGTTYRWDFGDGSISTAKNPEYTFFDPGIYRVELTVTGPGGTSSKSQVVNSYASPRAYFEVSPTFVFVNDEKVRGFNLSQPGSGLSFLWEFGDGDTSKVKEPFHKYMEAGVYDITLWAYSSNGCSDKYILSPGVTVEPAGEVRFSTVFTPNLDGPIERTDLPTGGTELDQFFFPPIREKVIDYKLQVFNRLGVLIFHSEDINIPWNGYYKGQLCSQGVYVWYVEGKYANGQPFKKVGDVTLLH